MEGNWILWAILGIIVVIMFYQKFMKGKTTGISGGSETLFKGISVAGTAITIFVILSYAVPQFEGALNKIGINLFTATIIAAVISLVIWLTNFYNGDLHVTLFLIIVALFLYNFSSIFKSDEITVVIKRRDNGREYKTELKLGESFSGSIPHSFDIEVRSPNGRLEVYAPGLVRDTLCNGQAWDVEWPSYNKNQKWIFTYIGKCQ